MCKSVRSAVLSCAILVSFSGLAQADISALTSFAGGNLATSQGDELYGWVFTVNAPITVTALGVFDNGDDGLSVSHAVGIFDQSSQALLGSATVPAGGGSLIGDFRYVDVSSFSLAQGASYVIAMTMPSGNSDFQTIDNTSVATASQISFVSSAFDSGSTLAFPTTDASFNDGMFGPNFTFTASTTPEPSFYVVLGLGLTGLVYAVRRRSA